MVIMSTLKGIFPEPKKEQKKNFIRENVKQLKYIQGKSPNPAKYPTKAFPPHLAGHSLTDGSLGPIKSSPSSKSGKLGLNVAKVGSSNMRKKFPEYKIKKGDMADFLRRKELHRQAKPEEVAVESRSEDSLTGFKNVACQTVESNLAHKLEEMTKITMLYPKGSEEREETKYKASGDSEKWHRAPGPQMTHSPRRAGDDVPDYERPRSRLNAILERKDTKKDPYLPSGYQKGVVPKYLRERKEQGAKEAEGLRADEEGAACPAGHVALPDAERKETLRMLRNSFAELVSELNKMPVKTDTLRMRNRKAELEKQLTKLEEGIKVFSRPKVFVKIGE